MSEVVKIYGLDFALINKAIGMDVQYINRFRDTGSGIGPTSREFVPDEFTGMPLGAQWTATLEEEDSYTITSGTGLITTVVTNSGSYFTQLTDENEFDVWCKITLDGPAAAGYTYGGLDINYGDYETWYAILYWQHYAGQGYSIALYGVSDGINISSDPMPDPGIDQDDTTIYFRIKYSTGDKIRFYWAQGEADWAEITYSGSVLPTIGSKLIGLESGQYGESSPHDITFGFARDHRITPRDAPGWLQHFDNNDWEVPEFGDGTWTGSKWTSTDSPGGLDLVPKGSWYLGFLPSQIRVTGDDDGFSSVGLFANSNTIASFQSSGGVGVFQTTADIDWDVEPYYDIESLHIVISGTGNTFGITNIEFYGVAASEYTLTIGTATGSGSVLPTTGTTYRYNTGLTISGVSGDGYEFSSWSGDTANITSSTSAVTTLVVPLYSSTNIQANFIATESSGVTETKSPASDITQGGGWTIVGDTTMWEALSDSSDATYILNNSQDTACEVGLGSFTLGAGTYDVTATVRMRRWGTNNNFSVSLYGDGLLRGSEFTIPVISSTILNYTVTWENVSLSTVDLAATSLLFNCDNSGDMRIYEMSLTIYTHVNRTWRDVTDDTHWNGGGGEIVWDGEQWTTDPNVAGDFNAIGTWIPGQKPIKMRIIIGSGGFMALNPSYPFDSFACGTPGSYEINLYPFADSDFTGLYYDARGSVTTFSGIEFYYGPDLSYEWTDRTADTTYWTAIEGYGAWNTDHWESEYGSVGLNASSWFTGKRPVQIRLTANLAMGSVNLQNVDGDTLASYYDPVGDTVVTLNIYAVEGDDNDIGKLYVDSFDYSEFNLTKIEFNDRV